MVKCGPVQVEHEFLEAVNPRVRPISSRTDFRSENRGRGLWTAIRTDQRDIDHERHPSNGGRADAGKLGLSFHLCQEKRKRAKGCKQRRGNRHRPGVITEVAEAVGHPARYRGAFREQPQKPGCAVFSNCQQQDEECRTAQDPHADDESTVPTSVTRPYSVEDRAEP